MPTITVILPFLNAEKTLARAIESIASQTFSDFECLLIDNSSADQGAEIAGRFAAKDNRFVLLKEPRRGIVYALNTGLHQSKGKFIARMDADDVSLPNRLASQYTFLNTHPKIGVVSGKATYFTHSANTQGLQRYVSWSNSLMDFEDIFQARFIESPIIHPTVMWRREIANAHGAYRRGDFPEDYELWLRWMEAGVKFQKIHETVLRWYDRAERLTRIDPRYSDDAFFSLKTRYLARWLANHNPHHPKVYVWGASKISRKRAKYLEIHGIEITAFIDISKKRQLDKKIIPYQNIPNPVQAFVLVYLKHPVMRQQTRQYLEDKGYRQGIHYLLVS